MFDWVLNMPLRSNFKTDFYFNTVKPLKSGH